MQGYVSDLGWEYVHANRVFYVERTGLSQFLGIPKYCFNKVQRHFPDALGALYIRDHLLAEDKATVSPINSNRFWMGLLSCSITKNNIKIAQWLQRFDQDQTAEDLSLERTRFLL